MSHSKSRDAKRNPAPLSSKLEKNLWTYATAAGAAGVGILALTPSAQAKVIYTPTYAKITDTYSLDLNHDGIRDFILSRVSTCASRSCGSALFAYLSGGANVVLGLSEEASALRAGAVIGPAAHFSANSKMIMAADFQVQSSSAPVDWNGQFANGGKGVRDRYLGLKFIMNGQTHYGWARFSVSVPNPKFRAFTPILTGYAYETEPNKRMVAGQTSGPHEVDALEPAGANGDAKSSYRPASLGMLGLGAAGLSIWRRENPAGM